MKVIEDIESDTIEEVAKDQASNATEVDADNSTSYVNLKRYTLVQCAI